MWYNFHLGPGIWLTKSDKRKKDGKQVYEKTSKSYQNVMLGYNYTTYQVSYNKANMLKTKIMFPSVKILEYGFHYGGDDKNKNAYVCVQTLIKLTVLQL